MAYFNHAFKKTFIATGTSVDSYDVTLLDNSTVTVSTDGGYVITDGMPTYGLNLLSQGVKAGTIPLAGLGETAQYNNGYIGYFDPSTNLSIEAPGSCCNIYLAGSAI